MVQKGVLPNGVRVVTEVIDTVNLASIGIWIGVGSRDENDANRGISHAIEHMLFKGTPSRTNQDIVNKIDFIGGSINAFTDKDMTCYFANVMSEYTDVGLDILSDMVLNPLFDATALESEKQAIIEELKMYEDDPGSYIHEYITDKMWPTHNLGRPICGYEATVSTFTHDDLVAFKNKTYTPDNVVITVVGNINHDQVMGYLSGKFSQLGGTLASWKTPYTIPDFVGNNKLKETRTIQQSNFAIAVPAYSLHDPKKYALTLLDAILCGSMSSRLFQEVREKRGLVYSIGSYKKAQNEGGAYIIYGGTSPDKLEETYQVINDVLEAIKANPVDAQELLQTNNKLKGNLYKSQETIGGRMQRLGSNELTYGNNITIDDTILKLGNVTPEDIQNVAKELFVTTNYLTAVVGP